MKTLVDSDLIVYRVGFTTEDVDFGIARWRANQLVEKILYETKATDFKLYLTKSGDDNAFRKKIYPEYKMNRKAPRPLWYNELREYLVDEWDAEVVEIIEADDALGIASTNLRLEGTECVIASIDKDLLQIPGLHYNFVKEQFQTVTEEEGIRFFYQQCLTGDTADNIKGIPGIGPKKAEKILLEGETEEDYFNLVRKAYDNDYEFYINGTALWILREPYPKGIYQYHQYGSKLLLGTSEEQ